MQRHILRPFAGQTSSEHGNSPKASVSEVMQHAARFSIYAPLRLLALIALFITTTAHADNDSQSTNIATLTSESMTDGNDTLRTNNEQSLTTPHKPNSDQAMPFNNLWRAILVSANPC